MLVLLVCLFAQPLFGACHLWTRHHLTYSMENDTYDPALLREAVDEWDISPVLQFEPVPRGRGNVKFYFRPLRDSVGLGYPPESGLAIIHSNLTEQNVTKIIQHEFGHALGLRHSQNGESIMRSTLVSDMRILPSDRHALRELYRCRYDSVTLLNGYTYLKFRGKRYDRIDLHTGESTHDAVWHPSITKVTAMYRDRQHYVIVSEQSYFEWDAAMQFVSEGAVSDKFPNLSHPLSAVLTLRNGTILPLLTQPSDARPPFRELPPTPLQGAFADFHHIYLVSRDDLYRYDENFRLLSKTRLCDDERFSPLHCCNDYSGIV